MFMNQWKNEKAMDVFSDEEPYDSDQIDSDVEAELYSVIHHETDNSTTNFEDSFHALNKENTHLDCEEFSISNVKFEKSNQIVLNSSSNSSTNVQIIEIADKFSANNTFVSDLCQNFESSNKNKLTNSFKASSLKRKSDSDSIVLDNNQSFCKKQKKNAQNASKLENNRVNSKSNQTAVLSSSDDDNDIICIEPSDKQKHFELNLSQIIVINSDSDTADSWCFKSPKNTSTPSTSKTKDLWFVNDNDLHRSRRNSSRYHESQFMTCNRCNQKGHSSKFCTFSKDLKCFICGDKHAHFRCKKKICAKCFGFGHDIKYCPTGIEFCEMCQMPGHHHEICPDLWRRLQRITPKKKKKNWRLFQDTPFFCYNCGFPGHFGALCKGHRMNTSSFPTWPFVLNYRVQDQAKVNFKVPVINAVNEGSSIAHGQQEQALKQKKKKKLKKKLSGVVNMQQISSPKTSKNSQTDTQNKNNCADQDSEMKERQLKKEAKKAKRFRRRLRMRQRRKEMLLQRKTAKESIN